MDWHQIWTIASAPDNVPIVALLFLVPFYLWYGMRQALANDRLIAQLESDPAMAKTHHRKTFPFRPEWAREVHVWPFLLKVEFLATIIVTIILFIWSITLNAPLEEPANPSLTMNPSKAPWYFLGLQEMLVYFDPWMAGVILPTLIVVGLMAIPYMDTNPLGNGYYTYKQRKFSILTFLFGFVGLWVLMVIIGTFIRGPGWMWFWPGMTWDHNRVIFETNRDLDQLFGITNPWGRGIFGAIAVGVYFVLASVVVHKLVTLTEFNRKIYQRMTALQYGALQFFMTFMLLLPVKIVLRLMFRIKYIWVTPWFNI
ncbi:MAG: cytochrome C [Acidobacteria bacterium RIFCSPLOWO2_12_FULL_54_10]|nr:MAG: cytochrome C [Acidobacteria bacterium RIFCSPLOWO2_12_FULL_54_10]